MRVFISVDMEGIAGIATYDQVIRGGHGYTRGQQLMTGETNAAIAGAFAAGGDSVTVNDSHGTMDNLIHDELDPRARLVFGSPKLDCMCEGLTADFDMAFFVGYHAAAGERGVLAHTYSGNFNGFRLNGSTVSEAEINALQAAAIGVPIGLLTGDDVICRVAQSRFHDVRTVVVKTARGFTAADSLSPTNARAAIEQAAADAVTNGAPRPMNRPDRLEVEIDMPNATAAELGGHIPTVERVSELTIRGNFNSAAEVIGFVTVASQLAGNGIRTKFALMNRG